jgi:hypothetical protein
MGAKSGTIVGIVMSGEPFGGATSRHRAEVFVTYPAYTASTDTTTVAAVGAAIAAKRRDGKTVALTDVCQGQSGSDGTTEFYNDTLAVSTDAITGELSDIAGTEIDAASGVTARPCSFMVSYDAT